MKHLLLIILVFISAPSFGALCKVYGISDAPQKLDCRFDQDKFDLRCRNGQYYLNKDLVKSAYHLEVEDGPVPLVFKTKTFELTVIIESKIDITAELRIGRQQRLGTCL